MVHHNPAKPCRNLDALEAAHRLHVLRRHRILRLHSGMSDDFALWDKNVPLNSTNAWEAATIWDVFAPTYGCLWPSALGGVTDREWPVMTLPLEGKTLCNAQRLRSLGNQCVVYAFGTGWDTTFEHEILRIAPSCSVRVFDPTVSPKKYWTLARKQMNRGSARHDLHRLSFQSIGLGDATRGTWHASQGVVELNAYS